MWRVLCDANVYISFLLGPTRTTAVNRIVRLCLDDEVHTIVTDDLLTEIRSTTSTKPKLARAIDPRAVERLIEEMLAVAEFVVPAPSETPAALRDLSDTYLLQAAKAGNADFLVTGDLHLLSIRDEIKYSLIVTAAELLSILEANYNK